MGSPIVGKWGKTVLEKGGAETQGVEGSAVRGKKTTRNRRKKRRLENEKKDKKGHVSLARAHQDQKDKSTLKPNTGGMRKG